MRRKLIGYILVFLLLPYALSVPYRLIHPPSTLMLADLLRLKLPAREWVPIERMSPNLVRAVVASEDGAFCSHFGVDFKQLSRSIDEAKRENKPVRATSTISQQLAKNLFLWHGRSWLRKILEAPLTFWLELTWGKKRILETYLNVAEWGDGLYGAQAAAQYYFGVDAQNLSLAQAALLATTLPNPTERNAARPGPSQAAMAGVVAVRVLREGADLSCIR